MALRVDEMTTGADRSNATAPRTTEQFSHDVSWTGELLNKKDGYLFGKPLVINSTVSDVGRRGIETLVRAVFAHNGGITFLQQLALMGAVYGFVDVLVKFDASKYKETEPSPRPSPGVPGEGESAPKRAAGEESNPTTDGTGPSAGPGESSAGSHTPRAGSAPVPAGDDADRRPAPEAACPRPPVDRTASSHPGASIYSPDDALARIARTVRLEIVEPARALPILCPTDWRAVDAYVQVYRVPRENSVASASASLRGAAKRG